jgi:hypothetical protein
MNTEKYIIHDKSFYTTESMKIEYLKQKTYNAIKDVFVFCNSIMEMFDDYKDDIRSNS